MNSLQLNLDRNVMQSHSISKEIDQFMLQNQVADSTRFKIITCTLEAIANVFEHATPSLKRMIVILHCDSHKVIVDLLDNSPHKTVLQPTSCPATNASSGRGLWIINNWMDSVRSQQTVAGTHLLLTLAI